MNILSACLISTISIGQTMCHVILIDHVQYPLKITKAWGFLLDCLAQSRQIISAESSDHLWFTKCLERGYWMAGAIKMNIFSIHLRKNDISRNGIGLRIIYPIVIFNYSKCLTSYTVTMFHVGRINVRSSMVFTEMITWKTLTPQLNMSHTTYASHPRFILVFSFNIWMCFLHMAFMPCAYLMFLPISGHLYLSTTREYLLINSL